jgi:UDP-N-acetyl-2-amino-2-deoxyglucuronate dehydrogenase
MSNLNFGLLGCGRVSEKHLATLTSGLFPGRLVAVADIKPEAAKAKGAKYGVSAHASLAEMLQAHPEIDVVSIAIPTGYHAEWAIAALQAGKHVIVEKPMALRVVDCRAMIDAAKKAKRRLFVIKQNRFNPAVQAARQALEANRFGKLVMGTVRLRWCRQQSYYEDGWHGTWALDGGVMSQQASHHLDLLQWFFGPIETVQCQIAARLMKLEAEDTAAALIKFKSGALGIFEATTATRPEDHEASLSILGEKGSVIIGGRAVNSIDYWKFTEPQPGDDEIIKKFSQDVDHVYGHGHGPYYAHACQAILENKPGLVEGAEGMKNIAILSALYESAACGGAAKKPGCRIIKSKLGVR